MQPLSWPRGDLCEKEPFLGQGSPRNFLTPEPGPGPGALSVRSPFSQRSRGRQDDSPAPM